MNPQRKILSVSQLNRESRFLLEKNLSTLWVDGEISNLSRPASGHIYFTLKDAQAQIRCAMFRNRLNHIRFRPENGAQVQIRGSVSLYEARGDYQLIAEHMEAGGDGALQRAFEQLKRELEREGLFNPAHKQPIPALPTRVGVITSPSGAAIHDILSVLQRRFPSLPIIIYPTAVQGEQATQEVVSAIQQAEQQQQCDLLVIARGGGSIEDLWTFNQEAVARAIYHCPLPIISAVGHETDFTIADFVADQRAPTPSAAAESISPDREQWLEGVKQLAQRLIRSNQHILQIHTQQLQGLKKRLRHPGERIQQFTQRLDESEQRLQRAQQQTLGRKSEQLQRIRLSLQHNAPVPADAAGCLDVLFPVSAGGQYQPTNGCRGETESVNEHMKMCSGGRKRRSGPEAASGQAKGLRGAFTGRKWRRTREAQPKPRGRRAGMINADCRY